jgi:hypothetical protein
MELPYDFPHQPPRGGYWYSVESFKRNIISIWLYHPDRYSYTADRVRTIWGFYDTKKKIYCAPVNSTKLGDVVDIADTTPYTSMQILKPMRPSVLAFC